MSYFYLGRSPIEDLGYKCVPIAVVIGAVSFFGMRVPLDAANFGPTAVMIAITMALFVAAFQHRHGIINGVANSCAIIAASCVATGTDGALIASSVGLGACAWAAAAELAYTDSRGELEFSGSVLLRTLWELILPASFAAAIVLDFAGARGLAIIFLAFGFFVPFAWAAIFHLVDRATDEIESSFA